MLVPIGKTILDTIDIVAKKYKMQKESTLLFLRLSNAYKINKKYIKIDAITLISLQDIISIWRG